MVNKTQEWPNEMRIKVEANARGKKTNAKGKHNM
jgi:hypothetical protein